MNSSQFTPIVTNGHMINAGAPLPCRLIFRLVVTISDMQVSDAMSFLAKVNKKTKKNSKVLCTRLDASYAICTPDDTRAQRATIPAEWRVQINLEASQPVTLVNPLILLPVVLPKLALTIVSPQNWLMGGFCRKCTPLRETDIAALVRGRVRCIFSGERDNKGQHLLGCSLP